MTFNREQIFDPMRTTGTQTGIITGMMDRVRLWVFVRFFAMIIAINMGLRTRERMSHNNGIAAKGKFVMDPDPEIPDHPFFEKGKEFPCQIRHAAATFYDDAMNAIRSIAIKLSDQQYKSPFDLEMNTGSISLFWNARSFWEFALHRKQQWGVEYQEYYKQYPIGVKGAQLALRRNPTSFTNLKYYAKTPFNFIGSDGVQRYAKYRVIPFDDVEETGINKGKDLLEPENQRVIPGEKRTRNYLKEEFQDRLKVQNVKYKLQMQIRDSKPDQDPIIFNCCVDWNEKEFPWRTLGVMEIEEALSWDESNLLTFSINNMPKSLGILPAKSVYDYNSLNYMRSKSEIAKKARLFAYKLRGMPEEIPDNDNRNSSTIV